MNELKVSLDEYENLVPYEVDIFVSMWVTEQKKRLEEMKKVKPRKR